MGNQMTQPTKAAESSGTRSVRTRKMRKIFRHKYTPEVVNASGPIVLDVNSAISIVCRPSSAEVKDMCTPDIPKCPSPDFRHYLKYKPMACSTLKPEVKRDNKRKANSVKTLVRLDQMFQNIRVTEPCASYNIVYSPPKNVEPATPCIPSTEPVKQKPLACSTLKPIDERDTRKKAESINAQPILPELLPNVRVIEPVASSTYPAPKNVEPTAPSNLTAEPEINGSLKTTEAQTAPKKSKLYLEYAALYDQIVAEMNNKPQPKSTASETISSECSKSAENLTISEKEEQDKEPENVYSALNQTYTIDSEGMKTFDRKMSDLSPVEKTRVTTEQCRSETSKLGKMFKEGRISKSKCIMKPTLPKSPHPRKRLCNEQ